MTNLRRGHRNAQPSHRKILGSVFLSLDTEESAPGVGLVLGRGCFRRYRHGGISDTDKRGLEARLCNRHGTVVMRFLSGASVLWIIEAFIARLG